MPQPLVVGRYTLLAEIAVGGMATVYLGRSNGILGLSRTVAIKRIHAEHARDPAFLYMLLDEARIAMRIVHPNVVSTLDVEQFGDELLVVMDYCDGLSLARLLRRASDVKEPPPPLVSAAIMAGVMHGLHAAHEARDEGGKPLEVVHRDVSPQNILVGVDGVARVIDFGIAKAAGRLHSTQQGAVKGKLAYMAPEQLEASRVDRRTDVFAAGVVLWEALTQKRLFAAASDALTIAKVLRAVVPLPSTVVAGLDPRFDRICARALARSPESRYANAREMALDLEACGVVPTSAVASYVGRPDPGAPDTSRSPPPDLDADVTMLSVGNSPFKLGEGVVLGRRYRLLRQLGKGGMGIVFAAVQEGLQRRVAVKVLQRGERITKDALARFRQEALSAAELGHPNIVQVSDFQSNPQEPPFLVMELLEGESLQALLLREKTLPVERAVFIATQILAALSAAHAARIIHRDIKPGNVFLTGTPAVGDLVKVLDFGIAKILRDDDGAPRSEAGSVSGTPAYMAPEQASGLGVDARSDLYAVGACLFEMLAGRRPFDGASRNELLAAIVNTPAPSLADFAPALDARLTSVVDRALAKRPADRPKSALEMLRMLSPFVRGPSSGENASSTAAKTEPPSPPAQPPLRRPIATKGRIAILVGLLLVVGGISLAKWRATPPEAAVRLPPECVALLDFTRCVAMRADPLRAKVLADQPVEERDNVRAAYYKQLVSIYGVAGAKQSCIDQVTTLEPSVRYYGCGKGSSVLPAPIDAGAPPVDASSAPAPSASTPNPAARPKPAPRPRPVSRDPFLDDFREAW